MRSLVSIFATVCMAGWVCGAEVQRCVVCEEQVQGPFYMMTTPLFAEPQPVCESCTRIQQHCFECNLPVKTGFQSLPDGRFLCRHHARTAVFSAAEAESLFKEVKRDLSRMFAGTGRLPDQNIELQLVDRDQLRRLLANKPWINPEATVGITETTLQPGGRMRHRISLLTGLPESHFAAVAAHEYGHTWLAENVTRSLSTKTVEGFCELVAYNLMTGRKDDIQKKVILANAYTQGHIDTFREAADKYQFHRVTDWMKRGQDDAISTDDPTRVLVLNTSPPAYAAFQTAAKTTVPDRLELKGISGNDRRRFALVNDCTLEKSEQAKVRVGGTNLVVRCLDITENSVVLKLLHNGEITELLLRQD